MIDQYVMIQNIGSFDVCVANSVNGILLRPGEMLNLDATYMDYLSFRCAKKNRTSQVSVMSSCDAMLMISPEETARFQIHRLEASNHFQRVVNLKPSGQIPNFIGELFSEKSLGMMLCHQYLDKMIPDDPLNVLNLFKTELYDQSGILVDDVPTATYG